ncbi:MAG: hypothetical protein KatS3mg111_3902 [Pirellulaceae bacterium]|nr:MAG: hypothetical protein KatS3mg111_3902 [Pirellulaceae bacterium]
MEATTAEHVRTNRRGQQAALPVEISASPAAFSLIALVRCESSQVVKARAANMRLSEVSAITIREALSQLVEQAKARLRQGRAADDDLWIEPAHQATDEESQFHIPFHL